MKPWRLISYFTRGTGYEAEARKLVASCEKLGVAHDVLPVDNRGSWQRNTHLKAEFILDMLEIRSGEAMVFVDADAIVHRYPELFDTIDCDLGLSFRDYAKFPCGPRRSGKELLSGTIYLANNEPVRQAVKDWIRTNGSNPGAWEQRNLQAVVMKRGGALRVLELPPTYCKIFDSMRTAGPAVIEHYQKSRVYRHQVNRRAAVIATARGGRMIEADDVR